VAALRRIRPRILTDYFTMPRAEAPFETISVAERVSPLI
jgi:hypothetical protein